MRIENGNLNVNGTTKINQLFDYVNSSGITGQVLTSVPSGVQWSNVDAVITGSTTGKLNISDFSSFTANTLPSTYFRQSGNTFGTTAILGTNDNQSLNIITAGGSRLFINNTGNVGVGTNTPVQNLEVIGTSYFSGRMGIGASYPSNTVGLTVTSQITGGVIAYGIAQRGFVQNDVTLYAGGIQSQLNKTGVGTLPTYYNFLVNGGGSIAGAVTNQMGYTVLSNFTEATNNYGFYGDLASTTGAWNLYMNGTADNYLAGRLGIGTTSPTAKLQVKGGGSTSSTTGLRVEDSNGISSLVIRDDRRIGMGIDNPNTQLHISGTSLSNPLLINTSGGTTGLVVNNNGNVGIGTTTPTSQLHIVGGAATININNKVGLYGFFSSGLAIQPITSHAVGVLVAANVSDQGDITKTIFRVTDNTYATPWLNIIGGGNVGIGTATPSQILDVNGDVRIRGDIFDSTNTSGTTGQVLITTPSGVQWSNVDAVITGSTTGKLNISDFNTFTASTLPSTYFRQSGNTFGTTAILGTNDNQSLNIITSGQSRLFVTNVGNVGIGTISPSHLLDIHGNARVMGNGLNTYFRIQSDASNRDSRILFINDAQRFNVGIPANTNNFSIQSSNGGTPTSIGVDFNTGNVGVGIINPTSLLHISGTSLSNPLLVNTSGGTTGLVVNNNGNVGIGIATPVTPFHVSTNNNDTTLSLRISNDNAGGRAGLTFNLPNNTNEFYSIGVDNDRFFKIANSANLTTNTRIAISPTGNVGIGTPSPTVRLDVSGSSQFTAISSTWSIIPSANYASIGGNSQSSVGAFITNPQLDFSQSYNGTTIPAGTTIGAFGGAQYVNIGSFNSAGGGVRYFSSLNGAVHSHTWYHNKINQLMSLSYRGNLEIGSSSIDVNLARLYVKGVGVTSSTTGFRVDDSNGIPSLIIRDNRDVGVGIDNPSAQFHISGNTSSSNPLLVNTSGGTVALSVNNLGNVGIGTSTPIARFQVKGEGDSSIWITSKDFNTGTNTGTVVRLGTTNSTGNSAGTIDVLNSGISSYGNLTLARLGGNVGIGTATPAFTLDVNGTARATTLLETSSERYKTNIIPLPSQLDTINKLNPVTFNWKDETKGNGIQYGLIAEEVLNIIPDAVETNDDGTAEAISYTKLVPILIKAVQELQMEVNELKEKLNK